MTLDLSAIDPSTLPSWLSMPLGVLGDALWLGDQAGKVAGLGTLVRWLAQGAKVLSYHPAMSSQPSETGPPSTTPADHPAGHSLREAAAVLGITPNAVRQRVRRGTLTAVKTDAGWRVHLPDEGPPATPATLNGQGPAMAATTPTGQGGRTDQGPAGHPPPPVDLAPLTEFAQVIERQNQRNEAQARDLVAAREAAAMWQLRAHTLEERLAQLTATAGEAPSSPATPLWSRWGWWASLVWWGWKRFMAAVIAGILLVAALVTIATYIGLTAQALGNDTGAAVLSLARLSASLRAGFTIGLGTVAFGIVGVTAGAILHILVARWDQTHPASGPPQGATPVPEPGSAPSEPPSVWRRLRRWLGGTSGA